MRMHLAGRWRGRGRYIAIILTCLLTLGISTVLAGATFDPHSGPTWLNPGYRWAVRILSMSNPDKQVCLEYTVTPPAATTVIACACDDSQFGDCNVGSGDWTCTIPGNLPNATVDWRLGTWSSGGGGLCGDEKTPIANGSFGTGPLAVDLGSFQGESLAGGGFAALVAGLALALLFLRQRRSRVTA